MGDERRRQKVPLIQECSGDNSPGRERLLLGGAWLCLCYLARAGESQVALDISLLYCGLGDSRHMFPISGYYHHISISGRGCGWRRAVAGFCCCHCGGKFPLIYLIQTFLCSPITARAMQRFLDADRLFCPISVPAGGGEESCLDGRGGSIIRMGCGRCYRFVFAFVAQWCFGKNGQRL